MDITIECVTDHDPFGSMAFVANWRDEKYRYHVWISLRPDRPTYPVRIEETIYKNKIVSTYRDHTRHLDINAASNAKIKSEIKRIADYDTLMAMFKAKRAEIDASDAMRAEADRLNAIFNAIRLLETANVDELNMMRQAARSTRI